MDLNKIINSRPGHRRKLFCLGCLTVCGFKNRVINKIAFLSPKNIGYSVTSSDKFELSDQFIQKQLEYDLQINDIELEFHWIPVKNYKIACISLFPKPADKKRFTILFSHGNGSDIGYVIPFCIRICSKLRVNVIAYDYSGYGRSEGRVSEKNVYNDIASVWNYIVGNLAIPPESIILYGNSLGSAPSCHLVNLLFSTAKKTKKVLETKQIGGLVIHSGMASGLRLFFLNLEKSPWFDAFNNYDALASSNINFPVYILHGKDDKIIPFNNALILTKSINLELPILQTWWVEGANHNNIELDYSDEYYLKLGAFLQICTINSNI